MTPIRVATVALVVLVGGMVAAAPLSDSADQPTTDTAQEATSIDSCTTITNSGTYELSADLQAGDGPCLHVRASGVTVDGNGHVVRGNGIDGSVGVLVYAGEPGTSTDESLSDVSLRDIEATGWDRGVQVGDIRGIGTDATLRDVTTTDNGVAGVYLVEVESATVDGLESTGNDNGVALWEVQDSRLVNITASDNRNLGVALFQDVYDVELRSVAATENGNGGYSSGGIYASTDARRNTIVDAVLSDNDGAGIRFSDSGENVITDALVEGNTGPGVHGVPANDENLRNVTVRDNGGPALDVEEGLLNATDFHVANDASATFDREPVTLDHADATGLPAPPAGDLADDAGVEVVNVAGSVTVTFEGVEGTEVELWRFDGDAWTRVDGTSHDADAGTVTGSVRADGVVAAVRTTTQNGPTTTPTTSRPTATTTDPTTGQSTTVPTTTTPSTTEPTTTTPSTTTQSPAGDDDASTLVVSSTRADHNFAYIVVVDGDAEHATTDDVAADSGDRLLDNGDGTVTIVGTTGDESGDAFQVTGSLESFYTPADPSEYAVVLDDEDVTDDLPGPG